MNKAIQDSKNFNLPSEGVCPEREPQIAYWLDRVEKSACVAEEAYEKLRQRLSPCLQAYPMADCSSEEKSDEVLVPVAERLRSFSRKLDTLGQGLKDVCGACEL